LNGDEQNENHAFLSDAAIEEDYRRNVEESRQFQTDFDAAMEKMYGPEAAHAPQFDFVAGA